MALAAVLAMLAEVDSLPGAETEPSLPDGQGERAADHDGFDVRRHIVRPLEGVLVVGGTFRNHLLEMAFQVSAYVGIGVLIDRQGGRGMLQEEMEEPDLDLTDLGQRREDLLRDQVKASRTSGQGTLSLDPIHRICLVHRVRLVFIQMRDFPGSLRKREDDHKGIEGALSIDPGGLRQDLKEKSKGEALRKEEARERDRIFPPRRPLGRTGFIATRLGIGDVADRQLPREVCVATIRRALAAGLNLIDTAPMYEDGYSEEIVGEAIRDCREGIFVIDKIDDLEARVAPQLESSLSRLGLGSTDAFVFHAVNSMAILEGLLAHGGGFDQLGECVGRGQTRFRGISSHHPEVLRAAIEAGVCDLVMFPVGPFVDERYVEEILPLARARQVGTVCFKTFGAGKLVGDTIGYNQPLQQRPRGKLSSGGVPLSPEADELPRLTVAECLHYTLTLDPDVALLGLSFPNEQDEAFAAAQSFHAPLPESALAVIRARAIEARQGKGPCWWNPDPEA